MTPIALLLAVLTALPSFGRAEEGDCAMPLPPACVAIANSLAAGAALGTLDRPSPGTALESGGGISEEHPDGYNLIELSRALPKLELTEKRVVEREVSLRIMRRGCQPRMIELVESARARKLSFWGPLAESGGPVSTIVARLEVRLTGNDCAIGKASYYGSAITSPDACDGHGFQRCPDWSASAVSGFRDFSGEACLRGGPGEGSSPVPESDAKLLGALASKLLNDKTTLATSAPTSPSSRSR